MEGLGSFLLFALLFYLMMRFGCGAHMVHGHGDHDAHRERGSGTFIDPVCGMEVEPDKGYGVMHEGKLYRFCSRSCLDRFDDQPDLFITNRKIEVHHGH